MKTTSSKGGGGESVIYAPLPPNNTDHHHKNVVVLSHYHTSSYDHHHLIQQRRLRLCLSTFVFFLFLSAAVFFLFPSDPALNLDRIQINHVAAHSSPKLTLDLSFVLTIRVRNRDFFSLDYDSIRVRVGYRGRELGVVSSDGGRVRARGSSYVNATLVLDGLEVIHDVFYLIEDLARGVIPFDTDTKVDGNVGLFFFRIPIKGRASCEVYVNMDNQTVVRQDCYHEGRS